MGLAHQPGIHRLRGLDALRRFGIMVIGRLTWWARDVMSDHAMTRSARYAHGKWGGTDGHLQNLLLRRLTA